MTSLSYLDDLIRAQARTSPWIRRTPTTFDPTLRASIKWEDLQEERSFKLRGVLNEVLAQPRSDIEAGLVTCTTGNHGIAVARAAAIVNVPAHICIPLRVPANKQKRILELGGRLIPVDGPLEIAEAVAKNLAREKGWYYISADSGLHFTAGIGTLGLEWLEQDPAVGCWLIPVGGGGLLSALAFTARSLRPQLQLWGVQTSASPYLHDQYYFGHMRDVVEASTIAEGLAGMPEKGSPVILNLRELCRGILLVDDREILNSIRYAYSRHDHTVEGAGAAALAVVLAGRVPAAASTQRIGILISGGNIDPVLHAEIVNEEPTGE